MSFTEEDGQQARSTAIFVLRNAELISDEVLDNFLVLLYDSGAPVALVSCYRSLSSVPIDGFCRFYTATPSGNNIGGATVAVQAEAMVLKVHNPHFIFEIKKKNEIY